MPGPRDKIFYNARMLRKNQTPAERSLWNALRKYGLGKKFRRQHRIGNYIVDFYCPAMKLAVELDGGQHDSTASRQYDEQRTRFLQEQGIRVLRFWNNEVLQHPDSVLDVLWRAVNRVEEPPLFSVPTPPIPVPSPLKEGRERSNEPVNRRQSRVCPEPVSPA